MNIHGVTSAGASAPIEATGKTAASARLAQTAGGADVVEISIEAKLAAKVQDVPAVRTELIERVKAEIAAGTYETPERIEVALDRLLDDLYPAG